MRFFKHLLTLLVNFYHFAREHKAWWIIPIILTLLGLALLMVAVQTVAPFIYTLF